MIPKVIHYCWFGNQKPPVVEHCIQTWKQFCPDYEIIEWNESNYDISKLPFMKEAYDEKKWAFVSDVARLDIIHKHGGIYLDTDVELNGSIDEWTDNDFFAFFESSRRISTGMGFGAIKGSEIVKAMLNEYNGLHFVTEDGKLNTEPCPKKNTDGIIKVLDGVVLNGTSQRFGNNMIYSHSDYNKVAKHLYSALWLDNKIENNKPKSHNRFPKMKQFLRDPKRFEKIKKLFGEKGVRIYEILVFDLIDTGLRFYIKRLIDKIKG